MTGVRSLATRVGALAGLAPAVRVLLVGVGLSPWLPALASELPGFTSLATLAEAWFDFQCHRDPSRALTLGSIELPVCARCFGIYAGLGFGALVLRPHLEARFLRLWLVVAVVFMLLDVATELLDMRPASSTLRVVSGGLLAWPIGVALIDNARRYAVRRRPDGS